MTPTTACRLSPVFPVSLEPVARMPLSSRRLRTALRAAGLLALAACASRPAPATTPVPEAGLPTAQPGGQLLYVTNQDDATVSVVDMALNEVVRTVDLQRLGFSANAKPHHVAVEPDGSHWYVTLIGDGRIVKLDRQDRVVAQARFETPGMLALHPTADLLLVGRSMTAVNPPPSIGVLRRGSMQLEELEVLFPRPHALALDPRTGHAYTASLAVNQLAAVELGSERVEVLPVAGPQHALMQFAVSPDGRLLAVSAELSHQVLLFDRADPMRPRLVATVAVGPQPFDPVFTPDGRWLYLGNKAANTVTVIDVAARTVAAVIRGPGLAQPHGVAVSPDGRWVYVSNNNTRAAAMHEGMQHGAAAPVIPDGAGAIASGRGTVVVIDTRTREIAHVIPVGRNAAGIGTRTVAP